MADGSVAIVTPYPDEGATGPVGVWWSPDGLTWTAAAPIDSFGLGRALPLDAVAFEFGFVMVGSDWADAGTPYVWSSPDGLTWNDPVPLPFGPPADAAFSSGVSTDGTALVAFGDDVEYSPGTGPAIARASMWMSTDASNWVQVPAAALDVPGSIEAGFVKVALPFDDGWIAFGQGSVGGADSELVWRSI